MRRTLGWVAAVAIVLGGLAVRSWRDDNDVDGSTVEAGQVVCAPDLTELCLGLAGAAIEAPEDTFARLIRRDAAPEAWVTLDPWPAMVDDERQRAGLSPLFARQVQVASTSVVVVGWEDRLQVLERACGLSWECLMSEDRWDAHGGSVSWQRVSLAIPDPDRNAAGVLALAWVSGVVDGTSLRDAPFELATFVRRQRQEVADVVGAMLVAGPAGVDVTAAPRALAEPRLAASQNDVPVIRDTGGPVVALVVAGADPTTERTVAEAAHERGWVDERAESVVTGGQGIALWLAYGEVR